VNQMQTSDDGKPENGDTEVNGEGQVDKRCRVEGTLSSAGNESQQSSSATTSQKASPPPRCNQCRQLLDDPDFRLFPGDPHDAVCTQLHALPQ